MRLQTLHVEQNRSRIIACMRCFCPIHERKIQQNITQDIELFSFFLSTAAWLSYAKATGTLDPPRRICNLPRSLPGINPASSQTQCRVPNPLCRNENSEKKASLSLSTIQFKHDGVPGARASSVWVGATCLAQGNCM